MASISQASGHDSLRSRRAIAAGDLKTLTNLAEPSSVISTVLCKPEADRGRSLERVDHSRINIPNQTITSFYVFHQKRNHETDTAQKSVKDLEAGYADSLKDADTDKTIRDLVRGVLDGQSWALTAQENPEGDWTILTENMNGRVEPEVAESLSSRNLNKESVGGLLSIEQPQSENRPNASLLSSLCGTLTRGIARAVTL